MGVISFDVNTFTEGCSIFVLKNDVVSREKYKRLLHWFILGERAPKSQNMMFIQKA